MFASIAPVSPTVSLETDTSLTVEPLVSISASDAVNSLVATSASGAVETCEARSAAGIVNPSVAPSASGAVDPPVTASASGAADPLVAASASSSVEPFEASSAFGFVNTPVDTSASVAVGPLGDVSTSSASNASVATSASVAVDPLAVLSASDASVVVLTVPPVAILALLESETASYVTATTFGAPAIISPSDKPIVGSTAVSAVRPDFLVPSVPAPRPTLRSVAKTAAEQQAVRSLQLRPSQWLCGPQHHVAEPAIEPSAASLAEVAAGPTASSIFMSEAAAAPMAVSTCKTKSTSDRVAEAMAATVAKKSKDPWPYVSDYFSFIGLRSNNEPCYECCLCRHKRVKVNAHLSTLYNLKSHVKRRHPGWSEAFREAIQDGRRFRRREKLR
jgi:hypothetical protein